MLAWLKSIFCKKKRINNLEEEIETLKKESLEKDAILSENEKKISSLIKKNQENEIVIQNAQKNILLIEKELNDTKSEIRNKDKILNNKNSKLEFIADVINALPEKNSSYEKFLKLLNEDYIVFSNENDALAAEAAAFLKLQNVSKQLELLTYDAALLNKNIVAIAGSFSSGKSSFINSFFTTRKIKLPTGMDQTTAISSYVMNGEEKINGYSYKGGKICISNEMFSLFSYGKVDEFNFNMKQIINHIVVRNNFVKDFNNLCFIDTPGFNPGQDSEGDYNSAITAISTANSIIWCMDSKAGTILNDEFDILFDIYEKNQNIGIYIVINKADLNSDDNNILIMDELENQLCLKGIPFKGMSLYTSRRSFIDQPDEYNYYKGISLSDFLDEYNIENKQKEEKLLQDVENVFIDYINADKQRIANLNKQIKTINILENSFSAIYDSKDEQISFYKARMDLRHFKNRQNEEATNIDEELYDSLAELRHEMKQIIEKDNSDIEKAEELCKNMKEAIVEVFGHELTPANKKTRSKQ